MKRYRVCARIDIQAQIPSNASDTEINEQTSELFTHRRSNGKLKVI